ncbi:MAG: fibronectin type III domain-containing protein [Planctomycetes bacterium]|nr:fibronectin type III domain-containing protein [Planctomycetota bacterium]
MNRLCVAVCMVVICLANLLVAQPVNLVSNGSFEQGATGWSLNAPKPPTGRGAVVTDHVHDGKAAYLYEKTAAEKWYPQLWTAEMIPVKPLGYYELNAMVDANAPFVFRYILYRKGRALKFHKLFEATNGWKRVSIRFRPFDGCTEVRIGFMMNGRTGKMWIDDVWLKKTDPFECDMPGIVPAGPPANRIHKLEELAKRTRIKPFEILRAPDGTYLSERLVFKDTATGATIWKMSWNPGYNRHHYSNMPCWNADGSKLMLRSTRDQREGCWLVEPDGGRWTFFEKRFAQWHRTDPAICYSCDTQLGEICTVNIHTGEERLLWKLPIKRFFFVPPSIDGKKLLAVENAYSRTSERSYAWLSNADGSGKPQRFNLGTVVHQTWFLKRKDHAFMFNDEKRNEKNEYQDKQWMCEPAKGGAIRVLHERHMTHAGVSPSGERIAHHAGGIKITEIDSGKSWLCMVGGGGHLSWECDDRWLVATMGNNIFEVWVDERRARRVCVPNTQLGYSTYGTEAQLESSPDGTKIGYASSMMGDCDFYVAVQRLPDPPRNVKLDGTTLAWNAPERCRELLGYYVYQDGKQLNRKAIRECRFTVPQPAVKYTVTSIERSGLESQREDKAPPGPPVDLKANARSAYTVELSWTGPSDWDVAHFNVYASSEEAPKPVQERRIASPTEPRFIDWGLQTGTTYQYVVTAVDRQGNESQPTPPALAQTPPIERFIQTIAVDKPLSKQGVGVEFTLPRDDTYAIWAQVKTHKNSGVKSLGLRFDHGKRRHWRPMWDFVSVGHGGPVDAPLFDTIKIKTEHAAHDPRIALKAGQHRLVLSASKGDVELLSMVVTNDLGFVPKGITSFRAERVRRK